MSQALLSANSDSSRPWMFAVAFGLIGLFLLAVGIYEVCCLRMRRKKKSNDDDDDDDDDEMDANFSVARTLATIGGMQIYFYVVDAILVFAEDLLFQELFFTTQMYHTPEFSLSSLRGRWNTASLVLAMAVMSLPLCVSAEKSVMSFDHV
eukprot:EC849593.1.p1 GENE.EC849593.1~~EC849593.1.p1  ORF type:complete len:150 (+),score=28.58 EC849593.1:33-482(+)